MASFETWELMLLALIMIIIGGEEGEINSTKCLLFRSPQAEAFAHSLMNPPKKSAKITIKPFRHTVQMEPQYAETIWKLLQNAIQQIHMKNASGLSFEELYRFVLQENPPSPCGRSLTDSAPETRTTWSFTSLGTACTKDYKK